MVIVFLWWHVGADDTDDIFAKKEMHLGSRVDKMCGTLSCVDKVGDKR